MGHLEDSDEWVGMATGYVGCVGFFTGVWLLNKYGERFSLERSVEAVLLLLITLLPMAAWELPGQLRGGGGGGFTLPREEEWIVGLLRAAERLLGMAVSFAACACGYWLFEEYHSSFMSGLFGVDERIDPPPDTVPYYHNYFRLFRLILRLSRGVPGLLALSFTCLYLSQLLVGRSDGFGVLGSWLLSKIYLVDPSPEATPEALLQHFLGCLARCFYAPLMFGYLCENLSGLHLKPFSDYMAFWRFGTNLALSLDVAFATVGYFAASPLLGSHIRSVEGTAAGWVSALACYQPFFHLLTSSYIDYTRNPPWNEWISGMQIPHAPKKLLLRVYGAAILILQAMFAWCTMSYGLRYSNLTYRGVVSHGPYFFTKHPAYIVKILAFALISVPWVDLRKNAGAGRSVRNVATLALLALLYVARAATEEAHLLSVSPEYRLYAATIDERHASWFSFLFPSAWF